MPITMTEQGDVVTIVRILGSDKVRSHLHELGFIENDEVTVISKIGENMILKVKGSRIALDVTMARRIMVR